MPDLFVIVDMQNDFVTGSLAVPGAESVIDPIITFGRALEDQGGEVVLTRDWHPINHSSFAANGGIWPEHCIQGTWGADFVTRIRRAFQGCEVFSKGTVPTVEQYSAFSAVSDDGLTTLGQAAETYENIWVAGLALDYCVRETVFDLFENWHEVILLLDGTRPVDFVSGAQALLRMGHFDQSNLETMTLETALDWIAGP